MVDDQWIGAELAGYRIEALIGRGGAGVVYRATHLRLQRPAAVKLLATGLAADAEYRRRFEREARLAASLDHDHIVPIYDAGYGEGVLYLAMRHIDGPNLAMVIENDGPMDLHRVCGLLAGVAEALDIAHHAGLVHRDVKPANVLLADAGRSSGRERAYLCDFGIARHTATSSTLTTAGQLLGTLQYCAPEQIQGEAVDGRVDQYALACIVFHCLTGRVPYPADDPAAVMFAHISTEPPRASAHNPALCATVDDVIGRALAKQPDHRYPDCATFLHALASTGNVGPAHAPQSSPISPTLHTMIWPTASGRTPTPSPNANQDHERSSPAGLRNHSFFIPGLVWVGVVAFAVFVVIVIGYAESAPESPNTSPGSPAQVLGGNEIPLPPDPASGATVDGGLAITPDGRHAYSVGLRSVSVIDIANYSVVATIPVSGVAGGNIAIAPDGRHAYVTKSRSIDFVMRSDPDYAGVVVIDTATHAVSATIATPGLPRGVAFTPDGSRAYVTVQSNQMPGSYGDKVVAIDTGSNAVMAAIPVGDPLISSSGAVAVSPDGRRVYVAGLSSLVSVVDTASNELSGNIKLTTLGTLAGMAVTPDGRNVYATVSGPGESVTVEVIDAVGNVVADTISHPLLRRIDRGMAIASSGSLAYVGIDGTASNLVVIDIATNLVMSAIPVSGCIQGVVAIAPDGHRAYVTCDRSVTVIETGV